MLHHRRASRFLSAVIALSLVSLIVIYVNRPESPREWSSPTESFPSVHHLPRKDDDVPVASSDVLHPVHPAPLQSIQNEKPSVPKYPEPVPDTKPADDNVEKTKDILSDAAERVVRSEETGLSYWLFKNIVTTSNVTGRHVVESVNFLNDNYEQGRVPPPLTKNAGQETFVIVIQVHNRTGYLSTLIETLKNAEGIENALLVFSHDIIVPEINELIQKITFARVIQIFYPFNMQLFPHVFPGQHENDCEEKVSKAKAKSMGCRNWPHPDSYGHYRVARLTQIKHHWWWKINYVFDNIIKRQDMTASWVLLLEEDHYVSPDFLTVFKHMAENRDKLCPDCSILCLGMQLRKTTKIPTFFNQLGVAPFYSSKYNMGMALDLATWSDIQTCKKVFCEFDDYNWDWSLLQISMKCLKTKWKVLYTKSPRVIHVGDCGVHTHRCVTSNATQTAADHFEKYKESLFPTEMRVTDFSKRMLKPPKPNGGWGDPRDHTLCLRNGDLRNISTSDESVLYELYDSTIRIPDFVGNEKPVL